MSLIAVGVGVAATAGSAYLANKATQKGLSAESAAINSVQGVNIPAVTSLATQTDLAKYQQMFADEASIDPQFAQLRNQGAAGVLGVLADQANPNSVENLTQSTASSNLQANNPQTQSTIQDLLTQAKSELDAGATLPASFQAELVRSGLAAGGAAGTGVAGEGATGVGTRTLLGSAGLQLQAQRQAQAEGLTAGAGSLEAQQQAALDELMQLSTNMNTQKAAVGAGAAGMGSAALPNIGLTGSEAANLAVGNTQTMNQKALAQGNVSASSAAASGTMASSILGGLAGSYATGSGGTASLGGWLSNLFTPSNPTGNTGSASSTLGPASMALATGIGG